MDLYAELRRSTPEMLDALRALVECESPSASVDDVRRCAERVVDIGSPLVGARLEIVEVDGRPHVRGRGSGEPTVLLLGHFDTVWPVGTIDRLPFDVRDDRVSGPGTFDMKAGIVQGFFAVRAIETLDGIEILLTSDEEIGSPTSRGLIEEAARGKRAVLVLEPSEKGAIKVARKGCSTYRVVAKGLAAHAGLNPQSGRNALVEIAHQILEISKVGRGDTTVTPTIARAGTTNNTVPATAELSVDVRTPTAEERDRVYKELTGLRAVIEGIELEIERRSDRPPMPRSASEELFARALRIAEKTGIGPIEGAEVGGGSDGNFTAAVGTPTLDGLGAVGGGAHADDEHVVIGKMAERAALVAELIRDVKERG